MSQRALRVQMATQPTNIFSLMRLGDRRSAFSCLVNTCPLVYSRGCPPSPPYGVPSCSCWEPGSRRAPSLEEPSPRVAATACAHEAVRTCTGRVRGQPTRPRSSWQPKFPRSGKL